MESVVPEDAWTPIYEHLDQVAGVASEQTLDVAADGLSVIADAHLPVVTIGRALMRARDASSRGLDGDRVAENLAWDMGAKGGSVVAGMVAGSMVFPVVGTFVGGLVGALFGGEVAEAGKARHLRVAQENAEAVTRRLGSAVGRKRWLGLTAELKSDVEIVRSALEYLHAEYASCTQRYFLRFPRGVAALGRALEIGLQDVVQREAQVQRWSRQLREQAGQDGAYVRGAIVVNRPDLIHRFKLDQHQVVDVLEAQERVGVERDKLALA